MRLLERTDDLGIRTTSATRLRFGLFALAVMTVTSCGGSGTAHPGHSPDTAGRQAIASGLSRSAGDKLVLDQSIEESRSRPHEVPQRSQSPVLPRRSDRTPVAAQLSAGYRTSVAKATDGSGDWVVTAEKVMTVNMATIATLESSFDHVASAAGGTYDGWEAAATP
jgi:hypothetical protein